MLRLKYYPQRTQKTLNLCGALFLLYVGWQSLRVVILIEIDFFLSAKDAKDAKIIAS